jgi:hypothetical protein
MLAAVLRSVREKIDYTVYPFGRVLLIFVFCGFSHQIFETKTDLLRLLRNCFFPTTMRGVSQYLPKLQTRIVA